MVFLREINDVVGLAEDIVGALPGQTRASQDRV
jgi:hypothetical protein